LYQEKAIWFAKRFNFSSEGYVYTAKVNISHVIAYINDRSEEEILVKYQDVKIMSKDTIEIVEVINTNANQGRCNVMNIIDLNELREARQEAIDWGNKDERYFSDKPISDAKNELLNDVASPDWATSQIAVLALEMIADGELVTPGK